MTFVPTTLYRVNIRSQPMESRKTLEWSGYFLHVPSRAMLLEVIQRIVNRESAFARDLVQNWDKEFEMGDYDAVDHTVYFAQEIKLGTIKCTEVGEVWGDIAVHVAIEMPNMAETLADDLIDALEAQHADRIAMVHAIMDGEIDENELDNTL